MIMSMSSESFYEYNIVYFIEIGNEHDSLSLPVHPKPSTL